MAPYLRQSLNSRQPFFWIPVVLFIVSIVAGVTVLSETRDLPFDSTRWKSDVDARSRMVRDLINGQNLIAKSRSSIDTMLGVPKGRDSERDGKYIYWLGSDGVIDDLWLEIDFVDDTVVSLHYAPD